MNGEYILRRRKSGKMKAHNQSARNISEQVDDLFEAGESMQLITQAIRASNAERERAYGELSRPHVRRYK